ncbi:MAG: hypothetical protein FWC64_03065 [Treponema sp.]|nr:hypothetical protein [Treponema sp.]
MDLPDEEKRVFDLFQKHKELSEAEVFKYFKDETKAEQDQRRNLLHSLFGRGLIVMGERKKDDPRAVHQKIVWVLNVP